MYVATGPAGGRATRTRGGLGVIILGFDIPLASGSTGQQQVDLSVLGDWDSDPLVQYMVLKWPGVLSGSAGLAALVNATQASMVALGYAGQPYTVTSKSALAVAAKTAENMFAVLSQTSDTSLPQLLLTQQIYQNQLIPVAQAVSAMPKPPIQLHLNLSPAWVACLKAKGVWNPKTVSCSVPTAFSKTTTRAATVPGPAPAPAAAPAPVKPAAVSHTWLYVGGGALVLGAAAFLVARKRRAHP